MSSQTFAPAHGLGRARLLRSVADDVVIESRAQLMRDAADDIERYCEIIKDCGVGGSAHDLAYCRRAIRFHNDLFAVLQTYASGDWSAASREEAKELLGQIESWERTFDNGS